MPSKGMVKVSLTKCEIIQQKAVGKSHDSNIWWYCRLVIP